MTKLQDISPYELMAWIQAQRPFALLDVREEDERQHDHIGGEWIPMDEVLKRQQELPADKPLVVYCRRGVRSAIIIQRLQEKYGMHNLYNLSGGLTAIRQLGLAL